MARDILTQQVIVSGRISDSMSETAPRARPGVALLRAGDGRPVPGVAARVGADGLYALFADPARALPPQAISLQVRVTAQGYAPAQAAVDFTAVDLARVDRPLAGGTVAVIGGVPVTRDIALAPLPVALSGRVTEAEDRSQPIPGATVTLTAPVAMVPVIADAGGWFTLSPLPVAPRVTLSITAPGHRPASIEHVVDFREPINQGSFTLELS